MTADGPKIIALTAPSGAGKTSIARRVVEALPQVRFSVSATTRPPRPYEREGVNYYFLSEPAFRKLVEEGAFLEYEEVYAGLFYGTLRSEVEQATQSQPVLLDLDVKGALTVKHLYGDRALTIFIRPPSLEALSARLRQRATESAESLRYRLARARMELGLADQFDAVVVNDDFEAAVAETLAHIRSFLFR